MFYISIISTFGFSVIKLVTRVSIPLPFFTIYNLNDGMSVCCNKVTEVI